MPIKISELTNLGAAPASTDEIPIVDDSASATKKVTVGDLFTSPDFTGTVTADGLTVDGTTDGTEELARFGNNAGTQEFIIEQAGSTGYALKSSVDLRLYADYDNDTSDAGSNIEMYTDGTQRMSIAGSTGDISFYEDTGTTAKLLWSASNERLTIPTLTISDGSITTTAAAGDHTVFNSTGADADFRVRTGANTHSLYVQGNTGNVGIGTSSPTGKLDVVLASANRLLFTTTSSDTFVSSVNEANNAYSNLFINGAVLKLGTGGTERMRIDSSGNVGIGLTPENSSGTWRNFEQGGMNLAGRSAGGVDGMIGTNYVFKTDNSEVYKYTAGTSRLFFDANEIRFQQAASGTAGTAISWSEAMRIDSSGNVEIKSGGELIANRADNARNIKLFNDNDFGTIQTSNDPIKIASQVYTRFDVGGTERMRILSDGSCRWTPDGTSQDMTLDASGNLLVGTTSTTPAFSSTGYGIALKSDESAISADNTVGLIINRNTSNGDCLQFRRGGTAVGSVSVSGTNATFNTSSDQRLKDNIVDAPSASDDIDAIQVRSFDWKADGSHQKYGMVAQELQSVAPEAVSEGETEEDMMGIDYSKLVPMLVKEIQTLRARVAQLEGEN